MMTLKLNKMWTMVAAGTLLVSTIGAGTIWSYVRTVQTEIGKQVRDAVPLAFELKRLDQMTSDLIPEIQANRKVAAQLDTEIEYLEREVDEMDKSQVENKAEMAKLRDSLKDGQEKLAFSGQSFSRQQVEDDLVRRLERYEDARVRLEAKQRILVSRRQTLAAATDKIRACQRQHDLLVEKSESLAAELQLLELAQANGNFQFDQTRLQQAKELAVETEKRIRTLHKLVDGEQQLTGEIPVDVDERSATEKFDEYFGRDVKPELVRK